MAWKKSVPGYPVAVLFAAAACFCTFLYAQNEFLIFGEQAFVYGIVYTVAAVLVSVLLVFLCTMLRKKISVGEQTAGRIWLIASLVLFAAGGVWLFYRASTVIARQNALYTMMATDYLEVPSNVTTGMKLYLTLLSNFLMVVPVSMRNVQLIQTALYLVAAAFVFFGMRIIGGRIASIVSAFAMLFLPVFPEITDEISEVVIFYLMFGAGLLVNALYLLYVPDPINEYPLILKMLIALFSGLFTGVLTGWDGGLCFLVAVIVFAIFVDLSRAAWALLFGVIYAVAFAGGFLLCAGEPAEWMARYMAEFTLQLPLPHTDYTTYILVLTTLSILAAVVFFAKRRFERVTYLMFVAAFTMYLAVQTGESSTSGASFLILVLSMLFGATLSDLLAPYERQDVAAFVKKVVKEAEEEPAPEGSLPLEPEPALVPEPVSVPEPVEGPGEPEEATEASTGSATVAEESPVPEPTPAPVPKPEPVPVPEPVEGPEPEEATEASTGSATVAEESPVPEPTPAPVPEPVEGPEPEAEPEPESVPEPVEGPGEADDEDDELHIPEGMVLPLGDETVESDTTLHIRFDDLPGTYSIGLDDGSHEEEAEEATEASTGSATAPEEETPAPEPEPEPEPVPAPVPEPVEGPDMTDFDLPLIEGDDFDI